MTKTNTKENARRIYKVEGPKPDETRLVRAGTPAQALRYCIANDYAVSFAEQDELVDLVARGVKVENAGDEA